MPSEPKWWNGELFRDKLYDKEAAMPSEPLTSRTRTMGIGGNVMPSEPMETGDALEQLELIGKLSRSEQENAELRAELQSARDMATHNSHEVEKRNADILRLKQQLQAANKVIDRLADDYTKMEQQLQAAREEVERLKKDPLCQALTDPDCCCHSCLKDAAIEESLKLEHQLATAQAEIDRLGSLRGNVLLQRDVERLERDRAAEGAHGCRPTGILGIPMNRFRSQSTTAITTTTLRMFLISGCIGIFAFTSHMITPTAARITIKLIRSMTHLLSLQVRSLSLPNSPAL